MPTGYTADVQSGKITDFAAFAMSCARAFGAMVSMRDEPSDKPYQPEEISSYHSDQIKAGRTELVRLAMLSDDQILQEWEAAEAERVKSVQRVNDERLTQAIRYKAMLVEVEKWTPPTPEHAGLKEFMTKQLNESLEFDCRPYTYYDEALPECQEWNTQRIQRANESIDYHAKEYRKEVERVTSRNKWVEDLLGSLGSDGAKP